MSKRSLVWLVCAIIVTVSVGTFSVYRIIRHSGAPDIPACVAVPAADDRQLTLIFTGDLMQHLPQVQAAFRRDGGIDYTACFSRLKNYFASADFVIANLETTLGGEPYSGYPQFRSPGALAGAMRRVGIDVAVAANNHICDRGGAGIRSTLDTLVQAGLEYTGVFADTLPDPARHPLWLRKGDFRVALLNYTYGTNGLSVPRGYTVNRIDTLRIRQDIAGARGNGATHVVLFLHWGNEYETLPNRWQRDLAARSHRWGAVGQDLRGDRFFDGQFCFEPAFSRYGRRHIGADRAVARRRRADGLPSRVPDPLDVDLIRPGEPLGASLRDRSGLFPRNGFAATTAGVGSLRPADEGLYATLQSRLYRDNG